MNELESADQRDYRYTIEFWPVYDRIKDIGKEDGSWVITDNV